MAIRITCSDNKGTGSRSLGIIRESVVSIHVLEGHQLVTTPVVTQYVNIQQNQQEHVDGVTVTHADRLGQKLRLKVKYSVPGSFPFTVRVVPLKKNVTYSGAEKARNPQFEHTPADVSFTTDSNGELIIEADKIFVSAAGGDEFSIIAIDKYQKQVTSPSKICTRRLLYYVEAKMQGLNAATNLASFLNEYNRLGIVFKPVSSLTVPHRPNLGTNKELQLFSNDIWSAYLNSPATKKEPYCVGIAFTDQQAVKAANMLFDNIKVTGGVGKKAKIPLFIPNISKTYDLWYNVDSDNWFVSCYFAKQNGVKVSIPHIACKPVAAKHKPSGHYDEVEIDLSFLPQEKGKIELTVHCVEYMKGGVALPTLFPLVTISTRAFWQAVAPSDQNAIIIHEVAHKLGMVSNGSGKLPDKPTYHYAQSGHNGNHCHCGIPTQSSYAGWVGSSQCVMFGEVNGINTFCQACEEVVRKLDLSDGIQK